MALAYQERYATGPGPVGDRAAVNDRAVSRLRAEMDDVLGLEIGPGG